MHNYSVDKNHDKFILTIILIFAGFLDALINYIFPIWFHNFFVSIFYFPFFFITFIACFSFLFFLFNDFLWSKKPINNWIVKCPDLNGNWEGQVINPCYDPIDVHVEIKQTWTKIIIYLNTDTAESKTKALTFFTEDSTYPKVEYIYYNKTKNNSDKDFYSHGGTASLIYKENCLVGNYYTDEQRRTYGKIKLCKKNIK
jgi:hypothetical protein